MEAGTAGDETMASGSSSSALDNSAMARQPNLDALDPGATAGKGRWTGAGSDCARAGGDAGGALSAAWAGSDASLASSQLFGFHNLPGGMQLTGGANDTEACRLQQTAAAVTKGEALAGVDDCAAGAHAATAPANQHQQQPSHLGHVSMTHVPAALSIPAATSHEPEAAEGGVETLVRQSTLLPAGAAAPLLPGCPAPLSAALGSSGTGSERLDLESSAKQRLAGGKDAPQAVEAVASPPASPSCSAPNSAAGNCSPSPLLLQRQCPEGTASSSPPHGKLGGRSEPARRMVEVVNLLRRRPHLAQTGLLWKLQASFSSSVVEQERLQG